METNTDDQICVYPKYGGIETRHRIETSNKHLRKWGIGDWQYYITFRCTESDSVFL